MVTILLGTSAYCAEKVYVDKRGVIRWTSNHQEVALFGTNYCLPSACDYRAASYMGGDRKAMIVEDLDHFRRMNWDALRLCFWGDFQNTDCEGNLISNDHLDLFDLLIAEATKRDIYMLLSPIVTYDSQWPEMTDTTNTGFAKCFKKNELIHNEQAVRAQTNYLKQLLNHCNPYTGRQIKDEPNILFVEFINEPSQFPDDIKGMVKYINRMNDALRSTGCKKITFYNVSQNFGVAPAIKQSKVQGSTYAWYPEALNNNHTVSGNGLLFVDRYEQMLNPMLDGKAKIVYEFDHTDKSSGYMYPAMVREFRRGGIQFATIFSYDMLRTASTNLGWQTQYINMVYTPQKAVSAMIAAEVMRRVPRGKHYGYYPENNVFGDFRVSYDEMLSELNSSDMFYYSNNTNTKPKDAARLEHIAGVGSSPVVQYDGTGIYFLDKQADGTWQLEVYPDIMELDDPFKMISPTRITRKAVCRERKFKFELPGLDASLKVIPGKYIISGDKIVSREELSANDLYNEPMNDWEIVNHTAHEFMNGKPAIFKCDVYGPKQPERVALYLMWKPWGCKRVEMESKTGFTYQANVDLSWIEKGDYEYHFSVECDDNNILFPAKTHGTPDKCFYYEQTTYSYRLADSTTSLELLGASDDWKYLLYSRTYLSPESELRPVQTGSELTKGFRYTVKDLSPNNTYITPCDATFSHYIGDRMQCRNTQPTGIVVTAYGLNGTDKALINFVDKDGRGFGAEVNLTSECKEIHIPASSLKPTKAAMLPQDWPGVNSYWYPMSMGRYSANNLAWDKIEHVQISLRDELYNAADRKSKGIVVERIQLIY